MGERNAGRRRAAQGGGDARHDRDRKAGAGLDFLAATAEHEGIARLQPHHRLAGAHAADQLGVDLVLRPPDLALRLPTATSSASRRARASTAGGTRSSCRMASASRRSCAALSVRRSGSPGPAPTMWAMPTGASRGGRRRARPARRAGAGIVAGQDQARRGSSTRRRQVRRRAGSTIRALTWARNVAASRARLADALGRTRLDTAAQGGGERRRGAAGRDRHHDIVAVDDRRQDEIAKSRPVGHVHRHAERLGDPLGNRVVLEVPGSDENGGRAAQVVDPDVGKLPHLRAGRARHGGATIGGRPSPTTTTLRPRRSKNSGRCFTARRPAAGR